MRMSDDRLSAEQLKVNQLTVLRDLVARAKTTTKRSAKTCKMYHNRTARPPKKVHAGDQVYVTRAPSYTLSPEERINDARRARLLHKSTDPFRVMAVRGDIVTIDQDGIRHPVPIDRVSPAKPYRTRRKAKHKPGRTR